jgi:beta-phosphoglucomutase-like phosphatase (HAD superfamily)
LEKLGREDRFSAVVSGSDVTRGKPDPQVFKVAAARLGVLAARCVVVEDAPHGVEAARRAGMRCVALAGTATRNQLCQADLVIDRLRELSPAVIRRLLV